MGGGVSKMSERNSHHIYMMDTLLKIGAQPMASHHIKKEIIMNRGRAGFKYNTKLTPIEGRRVFPLAFLLFKENSTEAFVPAYKTKRGQYRIPIVGESILSVVEYREDQLVLLGLEDLQHNETAE